MGETGVDDKRTVRDAEGTPAPGGMTRAGVWAVALRPEFGPWGVPVGQRMVASPMIVFGVLIATVGGGFILHRFAGASLAWALPSVAFSVLAMIVLVFVAVRARMARAWNALASPAGLREALAAQGREWDREAHARAMAAVRSVWKPMRRARWERLQAAAEAFDLSPPCAVVIDPTGRFRTLTRESGEEFPEPEDVGGYASAETVKARALSLPMIGFALLFAFLIANQFFIGSGSVREVLPMTLLFVGVMLLEVFRPARRRLIPGLADTVVAAPSLVVVRSLRRTRVFRADDSVLVLARHKLRMGEAAVTLTRDDGERVVLQYANAGDARLRTLWSLWLHPRASRWDASSAEIVPEHPPMIATRVPCD